MELSVLVPCYDEAANIAQLVTRVGAVLDVMVAPGAAELVLVDDGSSDETFALATRAAGEHPFVVVVRHPQNRGLEAAWNTGLRASRGRWVCILDADLQYRPEDLPRLRDAQRASGADIAQGWRSPVGRRRDVRYLLSRGLSVLLNALFGMRLHDNKSGFLLCRRETLAALLDHQGHYAYWQLFLLVAAHTRGFTITEVETAFDDRAGGRSFLPSVPVTATARALRDVARAVAELGPVRP